MHQLKKIKKSSIPRALDKVEQYRLLNEPIEAESICRDILAVEPDHQEALVKMILTLTDQFGKGVPGDEAFLYVEKLTDAYEKAYYTGIVYERKAKAILAKGLLDHKHDAFEWFVDAMSAYENAEALSSPDNDDAILRWNACVRTIKKFKLNKRPMSVISELHLQLE
jgi:hypothetical protein